MCRSKYNYLSWTEKACQKKDKVCEQHWRRQGIINDWYWSNLAANSMTMKGKVNSAVFTGQARLMSREDIVYHEGKHFFMKSNGNLLSICCFKVCVCVYIYTHPWTKKKLNVFTLSLGLYWMTYSIWPFGPSSMSVAPLFPENPVKMVVPTGVNCKNRETDIH